QQAYWNVATNANGFTADGATLPDALTDSTGAASSITFEFATGGTWGAGTGLDTPLQKFLNGIVGTGTVNTDQTMTFHNVPAGNHAVLVYAVAAPLNFKTITYAIGNQKYYVRVMNSDEYKPAPGFYRASSTDPNNPSVGNLIRFDNVQPDANGDIVLTYTVTAFSGQNNNGGVNAIQLVLNAPNPGAPPAITVDPQPTVVATNGTAVLSVTATGSNLTYQWRKNGRTLPNGGHVSGATSSTLTISSFSADDNGTYSVAVFNPAGNTVSKNAAVRLSAFNINDGLVAYFKLDETSGANAANSATGGTKGVVTGTPSWAAGKIANAFGFDGLTYIQVDNFTKPVAGISGSAWVNVDAGAAATEVIMRNAQGPLTVAGTNSGQFEFVITVDANDGSLHPSVSINNGPNVTTVTSTVAMSPGGYHHLAFSGDSAQLRLYMDGALVGSLDYSADLITPAVKYLSLGGQLSADPDTGVVGLDPANPNVLVGKLDDVALWSRGITADEVSKIYAAGNTGKGVTTVTEAPPTNLPGHLKVDSSNGQITVTWDNGTLQTAPAVSGPWTDSTAKSPFSEAIGTGAKFYRTQSK
ncbi:MAG TPA: LamG-like jellyroll fold domain-containing protein, partial [Verrucomicrobiae bacterium]|nr:LamG-like jellyroll fold domain-containing protein [Verrucomicrobiae bacterium]